MHINQEKKQSEKVFHFENVHNHLFITFIQDKNPDFFLKASHPQNNFCTLLSLDFIETVFVFLLFNYDLYISQNTFVHTITHRHTGFMLFHNEKHETVFEHSNVSCQNMRFNIFFVASLIHILCLSSKIFNITAVFVACFHALWYVWSKPE